jgi:hypothetical protein
MIVSSAAATRARALYVFLGLATIMAALLLSLISTAGAAEPAVGKGAREIGEGTGQWWPSGWPSGVWWPFG